MKTAATPSTDAPGRTARSPLHFSFRSWWRIAGRVGGRFLEQNLSLAAAGVGFYSLLALFPAIAALVAIYGLLFDPHQIQAQFEALRGIMPTQAHSLIADQLPAAGATRDSTLGLGLAGALILSFWGATRGTRALIIALNIAYDEREERGFISLNLLAFGLTFFLILVLAAAIMATVAVPIVLNVITLGAMPSALAAWLRWPLLALVGLLALAIIYRFGPSRRAPRWGWLPVGSVIAALLWLAASGLFSSYVSNFGSYNVTYGSLGAVIILLLWLYLSAVSVIIGGVINAETERQTAVDTTTGEPRPRGERGAVVADRLPGERPEGASETMGGPNDREPDVGARS